jgi:hypothetical protein
MSRASNEAFRIWVTHQRDHLVNRLNLLRSGKVAIFRVQYGRRVDITAEDIGALECQLGDIEDLLAKHSTARGIRTPASRN